MSRVLFDSGYQKSNKRLDIIQIRFLGNEKKFYFGSKILYTKR